MSFNPLISLARNAKRQKMDMQCDPQWVLDLAAERDQLRAELDAIRGQSHVVAHRMINELGVAVTLWQDGPPPSRIISDRGVEQVDVTAELAYALPPQQPDAVSVPRDLLQRLLDSNNRSTFCAGTYLKAHEELSALLSSRQPEVTE